MSQNGRFNTWTLPHRTPRRFLVTRTRRSAMTHRSMQWTSGRSPMWRRLIGLASSHSRTRKWIFRVEQDKFGSEWIRCAPSDVDDRSGRR
jgi:hypothetical protein